MYYLDKNQKAYPVYIHVPEGAVWNTQAFDFDSEHIPEDGIYRDTVEYPRFWYPDTEASILAAKSLILLSHSPTRSLNQQVTVPQKTEEHNNGTRNSGKI